jgi:hypothetical protein
MCTIDSKVEMRTCLWQVRVCIIDITLQSLGDTQLIEAGSLAVIIAIQNQVRFSVTLQDGTILPDVMQGRRSTMVP